MTSAPVLRDAALTGARAISYARTMSFWEDLSPGVKRYATIGGLLLIGLLGFRYCVASSMTKSSGAQQHRGLAR